MNLLEREQKSFEILCAFLDKHRKQFREILRSKMGGDVTEEEVMKVYIIFEVWKKTGNRYVRHIFADKEGAVKKLEKLEGRSSLTSKYVMYQMREYEVE